MSYDTSVIIFVKISCVSEKFDVTLQPFLVVTQPKTVKESVRADRGRLR